VGAGGASAAGRARSATTVTRGWHQLLKIRDANLYALAVARHDAWAGGYSDTGKGPRSLLEHFDGRAWHEVSLPARIDPPDGAVDVLAASSPSNLWMFGVHAGKLLAARWDGRGWLTRTPPGNQLLDTAAVTFGPADTWDFGADTVAHFTASGWRRTSFPVNVAAVSAVSSHDIWVYGAGATNRKPTIAAHWDGRRWTYLPVPLALNPNGLTRLIPGGIHAFGPSDVWVDGTAWSPKAVVNGAPMVMHWNGHTWQRAYAGPAVAFGGLNLMTADGSGDLWMANTFSPGLLHEHRGHYTPVPGPSLPKPHDMFQATDMTWLPGTRTLLLTGYLLSETTVPYGHVESYTY
jgi:hypothetical protein